MNPLIHVILPIALGITSIAALRHASAAQANPDQGSHVQAPASVLALDEEIQRRFHDTARGFGMSRLDGFAHDYAYDPRDNPPMFQPENAHETALVENLMQAGLQVGIYLGSIGLYGEKPDDWTTISRRLIRGPVQVTPTPATFVTADRLWQETAKAMSASADRFSDIFAIDGWNFVARPVLASEQICVDCHTSRHWRNGDDATIEAARKALHIGAKLGVVVYAYRAAAKPSDNGPPSVSWVAANYRSLEHITPTPVLADPKLLRLCTSTSQIQEEEGPHALTRISIFMDHAAAHTFRAKTQHYPIGSIIVKEKAAADVADPTVRDDHPKVATDEIPTAGTGGMIKREPGYDPAHGDWEYFYFTAANAVEHGRLATCVACHERARATDYVYGSWARQPHAN